MAVDVKMLHNDITEEISISSKKFDAPVIVTPETNNSSLGISADNKTISTSDINMIANLDCQGSGMLPNEQSIAVQATQQAETRKSFGVEQSTEKEKSTTANKCLCDRKFPVCDTSHNARQLRVSIAKVKLDATSPNTLSDVQVKEHDGCQKATGSNIYQSVEQAKLTKPNNPVLDKEFPVTDKSDFSRQLCVTITKVKLGTALPDALSEASAKSMELNESEKAVGFDDQQFVGEAKSVVPHFFPKHEESSAMDGPDSARLLHVNKAEVELDTTSPNVLLDTKVKDLEFGECQKAIGSNKQKLAEKVQLTKPINPILDKESVDTNSFDSARHFCRTIAKVKLNTISSKVLAHAQIEGLGVDGCLPSAEPDKLSSTKEALLTRLHHICDKSSLCNTDIVGQPQAIIKDKLDTTPPNDVPDIPAKYLKLDGCLEAAKSNEHTPTAMPAKQSDSGADDSQSNEKMPNDSSQEIFGEDSLSPVSLASSTDVLSGCSGLTVSPLTCTRLIDAMLQSSHGSNNLMQKDISLLDDAKTVVDQKQITSASAEFFPLTKVFCKEQNSVETPHISEETLQTSDIVSDPAEMFENLSPNSFFPTKKIRPILKSNVLRKMKKQKGIFPVIYVGASDSSNLQISSDASTTFRPFDSYLKKSSSSLVDFPSTNFLQSNGEKKPFKVVIKSSSNGKQKADMHLISSLKAPVANSASVSASAYNSLTDLDDLPTMVPMGNGAASNIFAHPLRTSAFSASLSSRLGKSKPALVNSAAIALANVHVKTLPSNADTKTNTYAKQLYRVPFSAVTKPMVHAKNMTSSGGLVDTASTNKVVARNFISSRTVIFPPYVTTARIKATATAPVTCAARIPKIAPGVGRATVPSYITVAKTITTSRVSTAANTHKTNYVVSTAANRHANNNFVSLKGANFTGTAVQTWKRKADDQTSAPSHLAFKNFTLQGKPKKQRLEISPDSKVQASNKVETRSSQPKKSEFQWNRKPGVLVRFEDGVEQFIEKRADVTYVDDEIVKSWKDLKPGTEVAAKFKDGLFYDAVVVTCFPSDTQENESMEARKSVSSSQAKLGSPEHSTSELVATDETARTSKQRNAMPRKVAKLQLKKLILNKNTVSLKVKNDKEAETAEKVGCSVGLLATPHKDAIGNVMMRSGQTHCRQCGTRLDSCRHRLKCTHCFLIFNSVRSFRLHQRTVCEAKGIAIFGMNSKASGEFQVDESTIAPLLAETKRKNKSPHPRRIDLRRMLRSGTHILHRWQTNSGTNRWFNGKILRVPTVRGSVFEVEYADDDQDGGPYMVALDEDYPQDLRIVFR